MYNDQVDKLQRAIAKVDAQSQELSEMAGELMFMKDLCEELKRDLCEKDISIEHLSARNYALWSDLRLKSQESEEEKKALVISLEESNLKCANQGRKLRSFSEEIVSLKALLESSQKKSLEAEEKAEALKERDDIIGDLEEKLKWKQEQFHHLEEAHEQLRREYKESKREWEIEKSAFLDGIHSLKAHLESQMHRDCSACYKAKEVASTSELEKLAAELAECRSELIDKEVKLADARKELASCHSSLMHMMLLNDEIIVMLLVTNSGISEAQIRLADDVSDSRKDYYRKTDEHASNIIKVLERCKGMLEESSRCQIYMRERVLQMETESYGKIREVYEAPGTKGFELAERIDEVSGIEFELLIWRSIAERLKLDIEENYCTRKELEASLLAQAEFEDMIKRENDSLLRRIEEKDGRIESLLDKNALLEQELEQNNLLHAVGENEKVFRDLP